MKVEKKMTELFENKEFIERTQIHFKEKMTSLYLKCDSSNYENPETILTTNPKLEFEPNKKTDYIFKNSHKLIYQVNKDTLKIYCKMKPLIPEKFESEIFVKIIEVKNETEWNLLMEKTKSEFELF